ncbi:GAF and ANTAR domain-containing protein [Cryobacterium lactosi]|uniref:GAF and ANTAR domain-containing protein n=1 Tax=Cryobacterium lactosi TaxID=1259202 RepID=UPI00141B1AC2|nr:GAF and ANTAR domain-containing protein [Cryobacterium lactosi]
MRCTDVDEIQFDLGEGPCWDAVATRRPILEPDLGSTSTAWPAFSAAIQAENIGALFAFPLVFGPLEIGAIDLYSINPVVLTLDQQQQTLTLSATISRIVLGHAMQTAETTTDASSFSRRMVHQATGMVMAQLGISAADAYLIIQARAFGEEQSMQDVGKDVVERRIRFTQVSDRLEDTP